MGPAPIDARLRTRLVSDQHLRNVIQVSLGARLGFSHLADWTLIVHCGMQSVRCTIDSAPLSFEGQL
jgi:hypothetical protein